MEVRTPPVPPPIEQFRISKGRAIEVTKKVRQKMFETEKGKTYYAISNKADKGGFYLEYKYPENCNREDILNLQKELIEQGYKVEFNSGIYGDSLEISWYE
jgi:hypothetical protein